MKKKVFAAAVFFACLSVFAQRVISPVPGSFSNRQCLVLNVGDDEECFYSFSGSDPLTSGFAYDGPVLIDAAGDVTVQILIVSENSKEEISVHYSVKEQNPFEETSAENSFVKNIASAGFFSYGDLPLDIPSSLKYSLGEEKKLFLPGKLLSLDSENRLSRYVPCYVTDGTDMWRFVIFVSGGSVGMLSKAALPFEISDWINFSWTGEKLIWCIDDSDWSASKNPLVLDRSVAHTVKWQSVAYEPGNPVFSFVIPAEPDLSVSLANQKPAEFFIDGDLRYTMEIISAGIEGHILDSGGFFKNVLFDTFEGDSISGVAEFAFYCDGVFQGTKSAPYFVDKKPPESPVFDSSSKSFYARGDVVLNISAEESAEIYCSVSAPVQIKNSTDLKLFEKDSEFAKKVQTQKFELYEEPVLLPSDSTSAVFYKVRSYAADSSGNVSDISEYCVIIDEYNYYLDSSAPELLADGSQDNPFANFSQALQVINSNKYVHFYVKGEFIIPPGENVITSNCSFTVLDEAKFIFSGNSRLVLRSASLEAENIVFEKNRDAQESSTDFFNLESSSLNLRNCEILGVFQENANLFVCANSVLDLESCGLTVQADGYACAVSGVDSKIFLKNCRVSAVAQTGVNFSLNGGRFDCSSSNCRVVAHLGRIAECTGVTLKLSGNNFFGEFDRKLRGVVPVWKDKDTVVLEDENNSAEGF